MSSQQYRYNAIQKVTLIGSAVDLSLGVAKVLVGLWANSQALVADGVHSFSDLATDFFVLYVARHSNKAADEDHPYGHGRIETLATVALGATLILVAIGIAYGSIQRLQSPDVIAIPSMLALVVALVSVVAKEWIYHYTMRVAKKHRSDMLVANAWHSRSDAISSVVVAVGIVGAMNGFIYMDAIAAVIVALMVANIGFKLVLASARELIDTALDPEDIKKIDQLIHNVEGVRAVHMLRSRKSAGNAFIDVHIQVDPRISVSEGHQIGETVRHQLLKNIEIVEDVTIHIDPEDDEIERACGHLPARADVLAALQGCWQPYVTTETDDITLHYLAGIVDVELALTIDVVTDNESARQLTRQLCSAIAPLAYIGSLQVCFRV